ncbi:hypothetical protein DM2_2729 [Halorubrum sp. DM2]|uniref:SHOCT domain-containing protein n=1 Tax=Halorubrum sp. DM2 TaxID=2527867 RepID=UPI0024B867E5|nr:SHOCT domain-containing protein [Halorubrum sp. DM2]VTT86691.1 hypothetical protein DM2_2729 [Halorubrum sp. DM2]
MDDGTGAALLSLAIAVPIVGALLMSGTVFGAVLTGLIVGTIAVSFVLADRIDDEEDETVTDDEPGPLESLRDRYARGELTEDEFERRVERLLETEDRSTARDLLLDERDGAAETEPVRER